jgi:Uncharacterised protein family (UPF0180)
MKITISRDYNELAEELSSRGYNVTIESNKSFNSDIIICNLKNDDLSKYNFGVNYKKEGTLIIDKGNKSVNDIEKIIKGRIYNCIEECYHDFT